MRKRMLLWVSVSFIALAMCAGIYEFYSSQSRILGVSFQDSSGQEGTMFDYIDSSGNNRILTTFPILASSSVSPQATQVSQPRTTDTNSIRQTEATSDPIVGPIPSSSSSPDISSGPAVTTPPDNDNPVVEAIITDIKDKTLPSSNPLYLTVKATDKIGGISKVEYYIDGHDAGAAKFRNLYATSDPEAASSDLEKATTKALDYIKKKYAEEGSDLKYIFRGNYKFDTKKTGCEVEQGYLVIMQGIKYLYDMRVSEDFKDVEICYKGASIHYNESYILMYKGELGEHKFYAKATDIYGATTKTEEIKFTLN